MNTRNIITDHHASEYIDLKGCKGETLDVNEWSGVVSCSGLHDSDDDDSTIDTASSTSVGTDTDTNASETESMKTGDGLKLIEVDDDIDDDLDDDKSSVYDADIFDQISNCDIGAINDYDKYDTDDSKAAAKIPEFIFLLTGEHKQDHEYTIEIEFEEEEIDYQNMTKNGSNTNNDDQTDACTMATKMLDQSNKNSFDDDDDDESFPCDDDSQYDDFDFGDDDEEEDISIINDEEEDDSMIIKVQELTSMTESMTSSADEDQVEDQDDDDNDDDNDSCISMIDNLMEQFESLNLASMTESSSSSSSSSVYTADDDELEVEANVDDEDNEKDDNDHDDTNTDTDCLSTIDNLMEQFEVDLLELKTDMSLQFGTNDNNTEPTSITVPLSIISSALTTAAATTATEYTKFYDDTPKTTTIEITEEDDVYIDTYPIEYDLDKEQHTTIKFQDHHHHHQHNWQQLQQQQQHNYPTHYTHHPCNHTETIAFHENPITTTIVSDVDDDDVAIYVDIDSTSSYDNNNNEQYHTIIECQDDDHRQPQHDHYHPCKRTETIEECDGGALPLPPQRPLTRIMPKRRKSEPLLRRVNEDKADEDKNNNKILSTKQQRIMDIVNDMKLIHNQHTIEQQPIKFNRQQYICIGQ